MTPAWEISSSRPRATSANSPGRRILERSTRVRGAPYAMKEFAAVWEDPTKPSRVTRWWFNSREEAQAALRGPSPFAAAGQREDWELGSFRADWRL
jgi:hypothetical protein